MTNEEFLKKMDYLYQHNEKDSVWRNTKLTNSLRNHLLEHIGDDDLNFQVNIKDYKIVEGAVYLYTDIGTFLFESKEPNLNALDTLKNSSISFLDFFYKLDEGNLSFTFSTKANNNLFKFEKNPYDFFYYYLYYYYNYRNLTEPTMIHRLFKSYNNKNHVNTIISLENLDNPDFQDFCNTPLEKLYELKKIYNCYYPFNQNQNLIFSMIVLSKDYEKVEYLENHLEEFKKFVLEEVSKVTYLNPRLKVTCEYLKKSNLINQFSEEELFKMYQKNTCYYLFLPEFFKDTVKKFENNSPMIYLDSTKKEKVHIQYLPHQLIEGVPFNHYTKYDMERNGRLNFKNLFLYNNGTIYGLYLMYYKNYQKELGEEGNLRDFIGSLFCTKTMVSIYNNPNITAATIQELEQFLPFYDKKIQQNVSLVKEELQKKNLKFYNALVGAQEDKETLKQTLLRFGLHEENIYPFIIQNKFLDSNRKEGVLNIVGRYFGEHLRLIDILCIMEEADNRNLEFYKMLEEKEINKKAFSKICQKLEEKNPILCDGALEQMEKPKRKKFIRMVRFGYRVVSMNITSIQDYREKFSDSPSYYDLIENLQNTEVAPKLIQKANTFEDFDSSVIQKSLKKK